MKWKRGVLVAFMAASSLAPRPASGDNRIWIMNKLDSGDIMAEAMPVSDWSQSCVVPRDGVWNDCMQIDFVRGGAAFRVTSPWPTKNARCVQIHMVSNAFKSCSDDAQTCDAYYFTIASVEGEAVVPEGIIKADISSGASFGLADLSIRPIKCLY